MVDARNLTDVLSRRHAILRVLSESPRERHELVDEFDDAKSTVYKGVSQLENLGLLEHTGEGLRPTLFGVAALRRYEELARTADLASFLTDLPPDAIDAEVFVGSELVAPRTEDVDRHLNRARTLLTEAEVVRGVVPAASSDNVAIVRDRTAAGQLTAEFVLTTELVGVLRREMPGTLETLLDGGVTLWETEEDVPFGTYVARGRTKTRMAIEFRDGNLVTGLLLNDTAESLQWAEDQFKRYRENAKRVQEADL